jgi:hypothetical protein
LSSGIPGLIRTVSLEWKNGKPGTGIDLDEHRDLLIEIASTYSDLPEGQMAIADEIEFSLDRLPSRVTAGVLRDWHADLFGGIADPDPRTKASTPLDVRIVNQLAAARISVSSLPAELQDRLRSSRTQ